MRTKRLLPITIMSMLLSGCLGFKPFQPPPYAYEYWVKPGATEADVGKALLECGANPMMDKRYPVTLNEAVLAALCMEANGFKSNLDGPWRNAFCIDGAPACRPGTPAPLRDPNKRINSVYCHDFPRSSACRP